MAYSEIIVKRVFDIITVIVHHITIAIESYAASFESPKTQVSKFKLSSTILLPHLCPGIVSSVGLSFTHIHSVLQE